jgi:hypothetical protein
LPLSDAARLMGLHHDHLARQCRTKLAMQGAAMLAVGPGGGAKQWWIYRWYDPRLRQADDATQSTPDLGDFTERQQRDARSRWECVQRLRTARMDLSRPMVESVRAAIEQARQDFPDLKISRSRLYQWDKACPDVSKIGALVDLRGGARTSTADQPAIDAFKDFYLHQNQPSVRHAWKRTRDLAASRGWRWCSYVQCGRMKDDWIAIEVQISNRQPGKYRKQLSPFIAQGVESWRTGELWIGDHKQLDLVCSWRDTLIRPWLTAWVDWRTRKVVGHVLSDCPNSSTILAAIRSGIKDPSNFGGPAQVRIDNGKDYDAWTFHGRTKKMRRSRIGPRVNESAARGIFPLLQIAAHFATPFNPNSKSRCERLFGDTDSFCKEFATYTGNCIGAKPERLNEVLADLTNVPTFAVVRDRLASFIGEYNRNADHQIDDLVDGAQRLAPADAFARWCDTRRVMADPKVLDLLLMQWSKPVTVGRNGITVALNGKALHYGQFTPELTPFKALRKADRRPLNVSYDPDDLGSIHVYDEKYRHVCIAKMNVTGGKLTKEDLATVCRNKANYVRSLRHVATHSLTSVLSTEEQLAAAAVQRRADDRQRQAAERAAASAPPRMKIVSTPLDGQAKRVEREKLRSAMGPQSPTAPAFDPYELLKNTPARQRPQWEIDAERGAQLAREAMA